MSDKPRNPVLIYTEQTPNPESLKYVTNRILSPVIGDFSDPEYAKKWSPFASALFELPYVKRVYINKNYIAITKELTFNWQEIMLPLKDIIKNHIAEGTPITNKGFEEELEKTEKERDAKRFEGDDGEISQRIVEILDTYIRPGIEMDGGNIRFVSFVKGIVTVELSGACAGCPSSTITLKRGIEDMLKQMLPEVKEVVEYNDLLMGPVF